MAKKKRRRSRKSSQQTTESTTTTADEVDITTAEPKIKRTRREIAAAQLEEQYAYIVDDLRRVLILAAIMFGLLIAVNIAFSFLAN